MEKAPQAPPRVLIVTNMWPLPADPAFGVFVAEQADALRRQGWPVDVLFIQGRDGTLNYLRAIWRLRWLLANQTYALVHAHYVLSALACQLAGLGRRTPPLVVTHHGVEVFDGWQAPLSTFVSRHSARTIVISRAMAKHLSRSPASAESLSSGEYDLGQPGPVELDSSRRIGVVPSRRIEVVPCGVDLERFSPGDRAAARHALGLPAGVPLIAWVGSDRPEKRLTLAQDAVEALRRAASGPNRSDADLGGSGTDTGPARAELLVVSGVPHADVPGYLRAADLLLVTSRVEGGPLVVKEALACNVPVVSTDVGDVREVIAGLPGCAVIPVDEATPERLAEALQATLSSDTGDLRHSVLQYDNVRVARRLGAIYDDVMAKSVPP